MTAKTFCNKKFRAFLGSLMRRDLALSALIFFIGFACMPLQFFFTALSPDSMDPSRSMGSVFGLGGLYTVSSILFMPLLWVAGAAVAGLMQTAYMHSRRAVDVYHSLPLTRPQLLCANYLAAFFTVAAPMVLNYLLTLILSFVRCSRFPKEIFSPGAALFGLLLWLVSLAGMLSVCFLVSTQTGSVFDTLIFTGILLAAPLFLALMHTMMCSTFLYGYSGGPDFFLLLQLSPLTLGSLDSLHEFIGIGGSGTVPWWSCLAWGLAALALLAAACLLYVRRPSERAESPSRSGLLALIIRVTAMLILCPVGGYVFASSAADMPTLRLVLLGTVLCGVLGFMILEAILNRGTKGLSKSLPLGLCLTAVVAAYMAVLCTGGLGYETRQPDADSVESVIINYRGQFDYADRFTYDPSTKDTYYTGNSEFHSPEVVAAVLQLQADVVADHRGRGLITTYYYGDSQENIASKSLYITYTLKNGKSVQRNYDTVWLTPVIQQDYTRLADCAEMDKLYSPLNTTSAEDYYFIRAVGTENPVTYSFSDPDDISALLGALRSDTARLGIAGMLDDHARVVAVLGLEPRQPQSNAMAAFESGEAADLIYWNNYSIQITESYADTIAALQKLGCDVLLSGEKPAYNEVFVTRAYDYLDPYFVSEENGHFLVNMISKAELMNIVYNNYSGYDFLSFSDSEYDLPALASLGRLRGTKYQELIWMIFKTEDGTLSLPMCVTESDLRAAGFGSLADTLLAGID